MARQLPQHPNLDHLKKQAKALLPELQQRQPDAQLADAQHAIAREYGFRTWPLLKEHVLALASARPVAAPAAESPFAGHWTANVAASTQHPDNPFRSARLQFTVAGDVVTMTNVMVDASGREERTITTITADGHERAAGDRSGFALMARWSSAHVLETVATRDGEVVGRGVYEVSADGKVLTVSAVDARANAQGWDSAVNHVIVLDRVYM